jgi:hypothetical protein
MVQNYQDVMAIYKWARRLDAFITFTCNPQWLEMKRALLPGQQLQDRLDFCNPSVQNQAKGVAQ